MIVAPLETLVEPKRGGAFSIVMPSSPPSSKKDDDVVAQKIQELLLSAISLLQFEQRMMSKVVFGDKNSYNHLCSKSTRTSMRTFTVIPFFRPGAVQVGMAFTSRIASSLKRR